MKRGAEFSVYQGGSPARRPPKPLPDNLNLRIKQRSLNNLTLFSEKEHSSLFTKELPNRHSYTHNYPKNNGAFGLIVGGNGGSLQGSPRKEASSCRGTRARSLSLSLTKVLSQSEHSLIPVPWRCRAQRASYSDSHPRRISREGVEVDGGKSGRADGLNKKKEGEWAAEDVSEGGPREGTAQLDKEMILTMLGDLEKALQPQPCQSKSNF